MRRGAQMIEGWNALGLGVAYMTYYVCIAAAQPAAGFLRDLTGDPAAPIRFAAATVAATVLGLLVFRVIERRSAHPQPTIPGGC